MPEFIKEWRRSEDIEFGIVPEDETGASAAALYDRAEMRIKEANACVIILGAAVQLDDGNGPEAGFTFTLDDASMQGVGIGNRRYGIWLRSIDGRWKCLADKLPITIGEAC